MSVDYNPQIVTSGLAYVLDAANVKSYPGSGTTWSDLAAQKTSTLVNTPTFSTTYGGEFTFTSTSSQYVTLPASQVDGNSDVTLNFWFKRIPNNTPGTIFGNTTTSHLQLRFDNGAVSGVIGMRLIKSGIVEIGTIPGPWPTTTTRPYYCTIVRSGTNWLGYLDGVYYGTLANGANTYTLTSPALCRNYDGYANGYLYYYSHYNRALSADEIMQNFSAHRGRFGA